MTDQEATVLVGFLTSGLLLGVLGSWLDGLTAFIKGRG